MIGEQEFWIIVLTALLLLICICSPFWLGLGGKLESAAAFDDLDKLEIAVGRVLDRYLAEEKAQRENDLSLSEWNQRKLFLTNRYIDLKRRHDYLASHRDKL